MEIFRKHEILAKKKFAVRLIPRKYSRNDHSYTACAHACQLGTSICENFIHKLFHQNVAVVVHLPIFSSTKISCLAVSLLLLLFWALLRPHTIKPFFLIMMSLTWEKNTRPSPAISCCKWWKVGWRLKNEAKCSVCVCVEGWWCVGRYFMVILVHVTVCLVMCVYMCCVMGVCVEGWWCAGMYCVPNSVQYTFCQGWWRSKTSHENQLVSERTRYGPVLQTSSTTKWL